MALSVSSRWQRPRHRGLENEAKTYERLSKYAITDDFEVVKGTTWPRSNILKLSLSSTSKTELGKLIDGGEVKVQAFIHASLYHNGEVLMQNFDGLESGVTLSKSIDKKL